MSVLGRESDVEPRMKFLSSLKAVSLAEFDL